MVYTHTTKGFDLHLILMIMHALIGTDPGQLRQQLQAQMAAKFSDMDKSLLGEIIERVMRRFGIG